MSGLRACGIAGVLTLCLIGGCKFVDAGGRQGNTPPEFTATGQSVDEGTLVILDAGEVTDDFGEIAAYEWRQTGGSPVELTGVSEPQASFVAPTRLVPDGPETLYFDLTVTDRDGAQSAETFDIVVSPVNVLPEVTAGDDQSVLDGSHVVLSGAATDADGAVASLQWEQLSGAGVTIEDAGRATLEFVVPEMQVAQELVFKLTAFDNETESTSDEVSVFVQPRVPANQPPVARAGPDRTVNSRGFVTLDGRDSFDPDGEITSYRWNIESGPGGRLWRRRNAVAWLWVPNVSQREIIRVRLVVTDNEGAAGEDFVDITVDPQSARAGVGTGVDVQRVGDQKAQPPAADLPDTDVIVTTPATGAPLRAEPGIAMNARGDYAVTWASDDGREIYVRGFDASGSNPGPPIPVNAASRRTKSLPRIAMSARGEFVVAWHEADQGGLDSLGDVWARRFGAGREPQDEPFRVGEAAASGLLDVAMNALGRYAVLYGGDRKTDGGVTLNVQRFDENGFALAGAEMVAVLGADSRRASIAVDLDGNTLVVWEHQTVSGSEIRARFFDWSGVRSETISLSDGAGGYNHSPAATAGAARGFAVVWVNSSDPAGAGGEILLQRIDADAQVEGDPLSVYPGHADTPANPQVTLATDGSMVTSWHSDTSGIAVRTVNGADDALGVEMQIGEDAHDKFPVLASRADGGLAAVAWYRDHSSGGPHVRVATFAGTRDVDLSVALRDDVDPVVTGHSLSYQLAVTNLSEVSGDTSVAAIDEAEGAATGIRLVATWPPGLDVQGASGDGWLCSHTERSVECRNRQMLAAATASIVNVEVMPRRPGIFDASVSVTAQQDDAFTANNQDAETTVVSGAGVDAFQSGERPSATAMVSHWLLLLTVVAGLTRLRIRRY